MTFDQAKQELIKAGYRVGRAWRELNGSWFVSSFECSAADFGAPLASIYYQASDGWLIGYGPGLHHISRKVTLPLA